MSAKRIAGLIDDATSKGAKVLIGKANGVEGRNVLQPVVLSETKPEMKIYSEEIFGPAMTFTTFKTNDEAIARANASEYGLAASVYGVSCSRLFSSIALRCNAGLRGNHRSFRHPI